MLEMACVYLALMAIPLPQGVATEPYTKAREAFLIQIGAKDAGKKTQQAVKGQVSRPVQITLGVGAALYSAKKTQSIPFQASPASGSVGKNSGQVTLTWRF
jgi:hypothetical protein